MIYFINLIICISSILSSSDQDPSPAVAPLPCSWAGQRWQLARVLLGLEETPPVHGDPTTGFEPRLPRLNPNLPHLTTSLVPYGYLQSPTASVSFYQESNLWRVSSELTSQHEEHNHIVVIDSARLTPQTGRMGALQNDWFFNTPPVAFQLQSIK